MTEKKEKKKSRTEMKTHIDEAMKLIKVLHILLRFHDLNVHVRLVHAKHSLEHNVCVS